MTFTRFSAAGVAIVTALVAAFGSGAAQAGPMPAAAASSSMGPSLQDEPSLLQRIQVNPFAQRHVAPRAAAPRAYAPRPRAYAPSPRGYYRPPPRAYGPPRAYNGPRTWAYRPWYRRPYYGTIIGGIVLGTIVGVAAYGIAPPAPRPDLCWYWADEIQSSGYWDYC